MTQQITTRGLRSGQPVGRRVAWLFAASALTLTLALGGCRSGAARQNGGQPIQQTQGGSSVAGSTSGSSTSSTTSSSSSSTGSTPSGGSALQQLQGVDQQNQNDQQQLNSAQNNAGVNYSSQENQQQP